MPTAMADAHSADLTRLAAAWRAGVDIYTKQGAPLYAELARRGAEDAEVMALSAHGLAGASPVHLFISVHYLLLGGIDDPLARYFATLNNPPAPPEEAWPHFARFCREHRDALAELLRTRTIQMTYVERCRTLLPGLSLVAQDAGAPLHLVEVGCSAGVMLTFDHYAYEMRPGERIGPPDAEIMLRGELHGGLPLVMPGVASRTGIDLNVIDPNSADDRRWMLATCFPELLTEQANLARAMDIVARTDIRWLEGDALKLVPQVLAEAPDPVCLYHSACLFYWPAESRAAFDDVLRTASAGRTIWRLGIEPSEQFNQWQSGNDEAGPGTQEAARGSGGITVTRYRDGAAESRNVAQNSSDFGTVWWLD